MLRWQRATSSCRQRHLASGRAGQMPTGAGQESAEYVRNVLDIPYQLEVLCILAIGHKAGEAAPRPTETLKWEKIHIGRYQMAEEPTEEA